MARNAGTEYICCVPDLRLSAADRTFFGPMADIVYGNAFAADRLEVISRLMPGASPEDLRREDAFAGVVGPRLEPFLRAGGMQAPGLSEADRKLLVCYIRAVPQLDALIERQAARSGEPLPVPFAEDVVGDLMRCGFGEERSLRYFAL
jgi:hypothetical protein